MIDGLEPHNEYETHVSSVNEVGESDPVLIKIVTGLNSANIFSSANNCLFSSFYVFGGLIILTLGIVAI